MRGKNREKRALAAAMKRHAIRYGSLVNGIPGGPDFIVRTDNGRSLVVFLVRPLDLVNLEAQQRKHRRLGFATLTAWTYQIRKDVDRVAARIKRRAER